MRKALIASAAALALLAIYLGKGSFSGSESQTLANSPRPETSASQSESAPPRGAVERLPLPKGFPFLPAEKTSLESAEAELGHIPRPDDPLASDDLITIVWIDEANGRVAIDYSTGLREIANKGADIPDPEGNAEAVVAESVDAFVARIHGAPAIVIEGNTEGNCSPSPPPTGGCVPAQDNPTYVSFYFDGFTVQLSGPGDLSTDEIVRLGESVG